MEKFWTPLQGIPPGGKTFVFDDPAVWQGPIAEFGLECRIVEAIRATVEALPQEDGILFRGKISGTVELPCDRCTDATTVTVLHSFDSFEPYPSEPVAPKKNRAQAEPKRQSQPEEEVDELEDAADESVIRIAAHGRGIEINPMAPAWQEFSLALPVKPLCSKNCKGLCPDCGANLNTAPCACVSDQGDPRLAVLRGLNLTKKQ